MLVGNAVRASVLKNLLPKRLIQYKRAALYSWNAVNSFKIQSEQLPADLFASKTLETPTGSFIGKRFYCGVDGIPIVDYKEVRDLPKHPEKLLIDVREPDELVKYGKIPTSINIPLHDLVTYLAFETSDADFQKKFNRTKPKSESYVIFTCMAGVRARKAAEVAAELGFRNVKYYKGSWADWAEHEKIPIPSS